MHAQFSPKYGKLVKSSSLKVSDLADFFPSQRSLIQSITVFKRVCGKDCKYIRHLLFCSQPALLS